MSPANSGSLTSLRELNRLRVLETVRERGSVSRAEISRQTGLARSTVSSLVSDLQAAGLVVESTNGRDTASSRGGRPPVLLTLNPGAGAVLASTSTTASCAWRWPRSTTIIAEAGRDLDVDHDADGGAGRRRRARRRGARGGRASTATSVIGAGVGLPGPIDRATGTSAPRRSCPAGSASTRPRSCAERLGLPVHVDNDANLGALAEATLGAGRGATDLVYLMVSSGIGAGLVLDGRLYRGARGTAGEIGHVLVDEHGPICRCGNRGCLETVAGASAVSSCCAAPRR